MKYIVENLIIPQDKRAEINNKILYLIDNGIAEENGITATDIASSYTGNGGLSGEKFSNYENYYDYSEAKKNLNKDSFYTVCHYRFCNTMFETGQIRYNYGFNLWSRSFCKFCSPGK